MIWMMKMPTPADAPLRKVTLNLYEEDVERAEKYLGHGWTTSLRNVWQDWLNKRIPKPPRKLGDLE